VFISRSSPINTRVVNLLLSSWLICGLARGGDMSVYQYSVPVEPGSAARAFLWIPPDCRQVRAVVVGQNNMLEQKIFAHPAFRDALAKLGMAEVWIAPVLDPVFRFDQGAGEKLNAILGALGTQSGYGELAYAPIVPIGHSACASYPWNFAAWDPARTLAILSVKGDAPLTNLTGSGRPNPPWGDRQIDGVPGLMVMGEYEWLEDRLAPALAFRKAHPETPLAMLADIGHGHFDCSDDLVNFLALFLRKAAEQRLPENMPLDRPAVLRPIDPAKGWLVERWHLGQPRKVPTAPFKEYKGDPADAFWCFDQESAEATQNYRADQIGKKPQLLGFVQDGEIVPQVDAHEQVRLRFEPEADGVTFHVLTTYLDKVDGGSHNPPRWTGLAAGSPLGHATGGGPITISRIIGPVTKTDETTFVVSLDRMASTADKREDDVWLLASQPGDDEYKSAVQQSLLHLPQNTTGADQHITFPAIPNQEEGVKTLKLEATSDAGVPVSYYVREGPAQIDRDVLRFTPIPPRSRFPVEVTVVAWQWGRSAAPKLKAATAVERTFSIVNRGSGR
jgi:hypothetical protein